MHVYLPFPHPFFMLSSERKRYLIQLTALPVWTRSPGLFDCIFTFPKAIPLTVEKATTRCLVVCFLLVYAIKTTVLWLKRWLSQIFFQRVHFPLASHSTFAGEGKPAEKHRKVIHSIFALFCLKWSSADILLQFRSQSFWTKLRDCSEFIPPTRHERYGKFGASHIELRCIRVGVKRARKMLDDNFGRMDGGADVEVEGVNVQHAYERGWGDIKEKVAKISVRG